MPEMDFRVRQYEFAAHIRNPARNPAPADVEDRRMAVYRELFYNNIEGFLSSGFPVLRKLLDDAHWHDMVRDFMDRHRCRSPLFAEIAREFLTYLEEERDEHAQDPPFLRELAHYEWVELALSVAEAELPEAGHDGDLLEQRPLLSPLAWALSYRFPVHRIGPDFQPGQPGKEPVYLLVYRNRQDEMGFIELNAISARLFTLLQEANLASGRAALEQIAQELKHPHPEVVIKGGKDILESWRDRDIVTGTTT